MCFAIQKRGLFIYLSSKIRVYLLKHEFLQDAKNEEINEYQSFPRTDFWEVSHVTGPFRLAGLADLLRDKDEYKNEDNHVYVSK